MFVDAGLALDLLLSAILIAVTWKTRKDWHDERDQRTMFNDRLKATVDAVTGRAEGPGGWPKRVVPLADLLAQVDTSVEGLHDKVDGLGTGQRLISEAFGDHSLEDEVRFREVTTAIDRLREEVARR